jgi:hypothetical protein
MLVERANARQVEGEGQRRWFTDEYFDLIVWYSGSRITGFQLCYDRTRNERALTWRSPNRYSHDKIDDGEVPMTYKMTPILVQDGVFEKDRVAARFQAAAKRIEPEIANLVLEKLRGYS